MKNRQKILNYSLALAVLLLAGAMLLANFSRKKADEAILVQLIEARSAMAVYRADKARIENELREGAKLRKELEVVKQRQAIQNQLQNRKNEILYKQLDSLNSRLGIRPDF